MSWQNVPTFADAQAIVSGNDLVARIGQFGSSGYDLVRITVTGPAATVNVYKGSVTDNSKLTTVYSAGIADAQFTPPLRINQGNDVIIVWLDSATYVGTASTTIETGG